MSTNVIGYKYVTENGAINDVTALNIYYGLPASPTDETQDWTSYLTADLDSPVFWYIPYHPTLEPVLGNPETFQVTYPEPITLSNYVGS
jgi:hypothetical protein